MRGGGGERSNKSLMISSTQVGEFEGEHIHQCTVVGAKSPTGSSAKEDSHAHGKVWDVAEGRMFTVHSHRPSFCLLLDMG